MLLVKRLLAGAVILLVLAYGILFSVQNTDEVPLDLLFLQLPAKDVSLWVVIAFCLGSLAGLLAGSLGMIRLKSDQILLRRKLERSEKEVTQLRANSVKPQ